MPFNPDEYLQEFDPDAYLSDFNPDTYLSEATHADNVSKINPGLAPMLDEMMAAPRQGLEKAVAGFARLGAAGVGKAYELVTGEQDTTTEATNKRIADVTGVSDHKVMQTIPGQAIETVANVLPMAANVPIGIAGAATMYNDLVDEYTAKGLPIGEARKLAATESAAMIAGGVGVGKVAGKVLSPVVGKMAGGLIGGGAGFTGGVEAARQLHNTMTEDRPELQQEFDPKKAVSNFLAGGMLAAGHPSVKLRDKVAEKTPSVGVAPEFIPEASGMSRGEYDMLASSRKLLEDKATSINNKISEIEQVVGKTGEATQDHVQSLTVLEEALNKVADDLVKHDSAMSGDVTTQIDTEKQLAQDIRKQELIEQLKARRAPVEQPYEQNLPVEQKVSPVEVALDKIGEASKESPEQVSDRILDTIDKLDSIKDEPQNSSIRDSLKQEIAAYEAIQRGEKPDLSWFEPKQEVEIQNKKVPTAVEVAKKFSDHKTVGDVLETMSTEKLGTPGQRILVGILKKVPRVLDATFAVTKATVQNSEGKYARGLYNSATHGMEIHEGATLRTILHEAVHAATVALLDQKTSVSAKKMIQIFNEYRDTYATTSLNRAGKMHYGFTNAKEFISEALSNPEFQKFLSSIKVKTIDAKPESLWTALKNVIKSGLGVEREARTALDEVLEAGQDLMDATAKRPDTFFQKLSEKRKSKSPDFSIEDAPTGKQIRSFIGRKMFGMNTYEGFFRDHPMVQKGFREIRNSSEQADKIQNALWHGNPDIKQMGFMDTLSKVKNKGSAIIAVMTTSNKDMAAVHDLFKRGFDEGKDTEIKTEAEALAIYDENLLKNGGHLTPEQIKTYKTLSKLFFNMYSKTVTVQRQLGKKHELPYRAGWYPAKRSGNFSIEISFNSNNVHIETFKTRQAAEIFRRKLTDGTNLKHLEISDVLDASKKEERQPNKEMADIIGDVLEKKYATAGSQLKADIDKLVLSMQTRGGKLGYHHQHRANVPGYHGSELFLDQEKLGSSFKEGIQGEVNNFGMNLRTLMVKHTVEPMLDDVTFKDGDPVGHAALKQMFDSSLGRNEDFLETKMGVNKVDHVIDKVVSKVMLKTLGREFQGKEGSATSRATNTAMRVFYATKMMAKPIFVLGQVLTTPFIIPELARDGHMLRSFYSFGKGTLNLLSGNKELLDHLKEVSQEYNVTEAQYLESMNLDKHSGREGKIEKSLNFIEDYALLGKLGKGGDSLSRLVSYATAYTHYTDLGLSKTEASYQARLATDKAMNVYDSSSSAPMFENLGFIGHGMKPLSSFGLNQLGNVVTYFKAAKHGDVAPMIAYGLVATAMGGVMSLPFIQEYERFRQVAERFYNLHIPSILEIFSGDESFLDRLNITSQDSKDVALYGLPALTGIDLSSSMRSNETLLSMVAAIALGQEDAIKLFPLIGATTDTVKGLAQIPATMAGRNSVGEGKAAIDSLITGPIGYGAKELAGVNTTRSLGENTGMIATGRAGDADMPRTKTDVLAGFLGGRSIEQRRGDQQIFEQTARDKVKQQKIQNNVNMLVESGDQRYIDKLIDLGVTADQITSGIKSGVYNKNVDQYLRFFRNQSGHIDKQKALNTINFGIKK